MTINVILADDHAIVLDGLVSLMQQDRDIKVIATAMDGAKLVRLATNLHPDVIVTDFGMPGLNALEIISRIKRMDKGIRFLCLSIHDDIRLIRTVLDSGYSGYLCKSCCFEELSCAIKTVYSNKIYLSRDLVGSVLQDYQSRQGNTSLEAMSVLTSREREIVQLFAEGYSRKEISERLHVSIKTVATHRDRIMKKLQIKGIAELTKFAIRERICVI